jgi:glycosyltransferase involved in cell wall biosynthesis
MRILFCSSTHLRKELGASKAIMELAEELERVGWQCELISPADLVKDTKGRLYEMYAPALREHLHKHAAKYDVIDYDHSYLPYPRSEFHQEALFVARSALLAHHFASIRIPLERSLKSLVHSLVFGVKTRIRQRQSLLRAHATVSHADLINVPNSDDKARLLEWGVPEEKIVVLPLGINTTKRDLFNSVSSEPPAKPKVAFVGTFDSRKGARDFPGIVRRIIKSVPDISFRLLGTGRNEEEVITFFQKEDRGSLEIIPQYRPDKLPELLAPCSVGIFPSYIEGFGFGVLEMLAASIPVIAYNSPGPPMMLPPDWLVPRGDAKTMSVKVVDLLLDNRRLVQARTEAKRRSEEFCWKTIARQTSEIYFQRWQKKRSGFPVEVSA